MKKSKFSEEQILFALKQGGADGSAEASRALVASQLSRARRCTSAEEGACGIGHGLIVATQSSGVPARLALGSA